MANLLSKSTRRVEKIFPRGNNFEELLRSARKEVRAYNRSVTVALKPLEPPLYNALAAIYRLCRHLDANPKEREKFLAEHGSHGNAATGYQPVVRTLMGSCHDVTKGQITKYAGTIAVAAERRVSPEQFVGFVKRNGGVKGAYNAFATPKVGPLEALAEIKIEAAALQRFLEHDEPARFKPIRQTEGHQGYALAVIEVAKDGSFKLYRLLDRDPASVEQALKLEMKRSARRA